MIKAKYSEYYSNEEIARLFLNAMSFAKELGRLEREHQEKDSNTISADLFNDTTETFFEKLKEILDRESYQYVLASFRGEL